MKKRLVRMAVAVAMTAPLVGITGAGVAHAGTYVLYLTNVSAATCHNAGDAGVNAGVFSKYFCNRYRPIAAPNSYDLYVMYR